MASRPLSSAQAEVLQVVFRLLKQERAEHALPLAQELVSAAPHAPDALHVLALCLARLGRADASDRAFCRALALAPDNPLLLSNYAGMWRQARDPRRAMPIAERLVRVASRSAKAWSDLATTAQGVGDSARALEAAERATELEPTSRGAWWVLGQAARAREQIPIAILAFERLVELEPSDVAAQVALAATYRLAGQAERAISSLQVVMQYRDPEPRIADALAGALLDAGRAAEAIAMTKRTAREHPDFIPGLVTLSQLLWEYGDTEGDDDDPARALREAIARAPRDTERRVALANFLMHTNAHAEALEQTRWLRAHADGPPFALMEAQILDSLGRIGQARALFERIMRDDQAPPAASIAFARHLLGAGEPAGAASALESALARDRVSQEAWGYLATAWRLLGDPREHWLCDYDRLIGAVEVGPPAPFKDRGAWLGALGSELDAMHLACREPMTQSLRHGSQTPGRLFGRASTVLEGLRNAVMRSVEGWLAGLPDDHAHPFLGRRRPHLRIGGSWSIRLRSSGRHVNHLHSEGWMSSAFYVALPPCMVTERSSEGAIQFGQPPTELGLDLEPRRILQPREGMLVLFPSYMWHGTVPFHDVAPRVTIAFDMVPSDR